ncbi:iron ABC transporter permease [Clostridium argentinense]|nr:iron ABC transporter permease [Clostridium argentinense]NFP51577.1 iron ABC transporter permease [Clostridium argentinense]NFP74058.1 iron ABC transporter permease [Clostridium argentinense]NFP78045.1 iron ABC transporter permease [Clostridium argentinense]
MWNKENTRKERNSVKITSAFTKWIRTKTGYWLSLLILVGILLISILISVSVGVAGGNLNILLHTLTYKGNLSEIGKVMLEMRMPRVLAACFTGAAFALAGAVMQGITRNPLADAGLLGINAGAGFLVSLTAVFLPSISALSMMVAAFIGSIIAVLMVYGLGMGKGKSESIQLILAGSAVSALLTALSQGISLVFGLSKSLSFWTAGSLSGITWQQLIITIPWIVGAALLSQFLSSQLSILALGEESAAGLGINVKLVRLIGMAAVLIMAGASVSLVGGISFIGLIVPHSARFFVGTDYGRLLPVCALLGAILLVLADIVARTINAPFDTPVGALVSAIGVPIFLALTYQRKGAII